MTVRNVSLDSIAANAGCLEGVDLQTVAGYWKRLLDGDVAPPILLWKANRDRFHVISDGHHRVMAALLAGRSHILAEIVVTAAPALSWRWPRVVPVRTGAPVELVRREIRRDRRKRSA